MLALLAKTICIVKQTYKKLYKIWADKLYSLKSIVYILSVLVVKSYLGKIKGFKKVSKIISGIFWKTAHFLSLL